MSGFGGFMRFVSAARLATWIFLAWAAAGLGLHDAWCWARDGVAANAQNEKAEAAEEWPSKEYHDVLRDGKKNLPMIRELITMWPGAKHLITHYTGEAGPTFWTSRVFIYKRYEI